MSDSNELKKFIKLKLESEKEYELPIFIMHEESSHTQKNPNTAIKQNLEIDKSGLYYAVLDMKIASLAKEVTSYSVYFWGSGFINWICKIYDVPITMNIFQEKKI